MQTIRISSLLVIVPLLIISKLCMAQATIRFPQAGDNFNAHHVYPIELLKLALSYHKSAPQIHPSDYFMTQGRAVKQLRQGKDIEVMWTMTSREREKEIRPIRIPLYKGLIGWRLFLTTPEYIASHTAPNISRLQEANVIQGHDWPDTEILRFNQFNVNSAPTYDGLFKILSLNRAELFPRSVIEIWDELDIHKSSNIILETSTIISYPTATYFFVANDNELLADIIESGLRQAHQDGRFDALFQKHYAKPINKAKLSQRKHFRLSNPLLPKKTPLSEKSLWFHLDQD
jgi:hypothetical protein